MEQDLSSPGAGGGFIDPVAGTFEWMDSTAWVAQQPPAAAPFDNWSTTPLSIADYNAWCAGGTGTGAAAARSVLLPNTRVAILGGGEELAALRFSLEWPETMRQPWAELGLLDSNLQSFLVVVDGALVPQPPPQGGGQ